MNRKLILLFVFFPLLLTAAGCGLPEKTELSERLIIEAVGVDRVDGGYAVTVQALDALAVGVDEGAPESGVTKCYTFYGTTVGEALAQIAPQTGLVPLYSQARLLALGFETARDGLCEALDFFLREHHTRADITVAAAEQTAQELLTAPFGKTKVSADVLQDALAQTGSGGAPLTPLYRFMNLLLSETDAAFCPLLGVEKNPLSEDQLICVRGAILFQGTKIGTVISADGLTMLRALTDGLSGDALTLTADGIRCTLRIAKCGTKIRQTDANAPFRFQVKTDAVCDITEVSGPDLTQLTPEQVKEIRTAASRLLTERAATLLDECFYQNGCDVCRFYRRFRLLHPVRYRKATAAGPLSPADFPCEIVCTVTIRRTGKEIIKQD